MWKQLMSNRELLEQQYDVLAGHWPQNKNEVVLVVDKNNEISDFTLYTLGVRNASDLGEIVPKIMAGKDYDAPEEMSFSYDDLLNLKFKLILPSAIYQKNADGTWAEEDSTANGTKIFPSKLVGSACPFGRIAYSHSPFKFCQSARSIPGRGYSGNTFRGSTFSAQSVLILSPAGFHCAPALQIVANAQKANNNFLMILFTF